jgi:mono/diheme cytochrome c family protein
MAGKGRVIFALVSAAALGLSACRDANQGGRTAQVTTGPLARIDFNTHVQPILSENCYACHGPDLGGRKANLRLDREETAFAKREHGPVIVRGDPDRSPLIQRLETTDPKKIMPPPESHKTLKPQEIALLRQWVKENAVYAEHWAFVAPKQADPPTVTNATWASRPLDRFILDRLHRAGLNPNPEADRRTLIRRVTLDLTGLLPTPAEVEAFVNDASTNAYEQVVDRLLASPRYGEHRARYWLDYVRYADTHGIHFDNYRSIWPYRDYVIKAYNDNKPFDQFTREQLAGDLYPATNIDQIVATGFVRCNVTSNEGGGVPEEFQANLVRDRVEAFGAVYMGLTVQCASCHDHKFDPTTTRDFYQLAAFFNNTADKSWDENIAEPRPIARVPQADKLAAFHDVLARKAALIGKMDERRKQTPELVAKWLAGGGRPQAVSVTGLVLRLRLDEGQGDVVTNSAPGASPLAYTSTVSRLVWKEEWVHWPAMRMDMSTRMELGALGDFDANQPFSAGGWFMVRGEPGNGGAKSGSFLSKMSDAARKHRGWDILCSDGIIRPHLVDTWPESAIMVASEEKLEPFKWHHILFTYDGSSKAAGLKLYFDGQPARTKVENDTLHGSIRSEAPLQLGRRHPDYDVVRQARYQDIRVYARALTPEEAARVPNEDIAAEVVAMPMDQWNADQRHTVEQFYQMHVDKDLPGWKAERAKLDGELDALAQGGAATLIAAEKPRQAADHVLGRGVYSQRGERVYPGLPHYLPKPAGQTANRRDLAEWVVSPANPLTARVVVNRMWQELFGMGLVETADDFGIMGQHPSHPELLDWLAVDFREHQWDVKRFYKDLVLSSAYRQSPAISHQALQKDPRNRLLSRGPRGRMDAEMLRDCALQSAGLLVDRIGGPSVKPYQPAGLWESVTMPESNTLHYDQSHGESLYRRSLYTFWKRFSPPPTMETFDAPGRDVSCLRRQRTNTPLQALVTMNATEFMEAARKLAERILKEGGSESATRVEFLGRTLLGRPFAANEQQVLQTHALGFSGYFATNAAEAAKLLGVGESKADEKLPAPELAAWTLVASQVMNADEMLNK